MTDERSLWRKTRLAGGLAYRVARMHSEMVKVLSRLCEDNGFTLNVWRVFSAIGSFEPISAIEICRLTTIDKAMVSRVIKQLADQNLIERRILNTDARLVENYLSDSGRKKYTKVAKEIDKLQNDLMAGIDEQTAKEFIAMLELLEGRTRLVREANATRKLAKLKPAKRRRKAA